MSHITNPKKSSTLHKGPLEIHLTKMQSTHIYTHAFTLRRKFQVVFQPWLNSFSVAWNIEIQLSKFTKTLDMNILYKFIHLFRLLLSTSSNLGKITENSLHCFVCLLIITTLHMYTCFNYQEDYLSMNTSYWNRLSLTMYHLRLYSTQ